MIAVEINHTMGPARERKTERVLRKLIPKWYASIKPLPQSPDIYAGEEAEGL